MGLFAIKVISKDLNVKPSDVKEMEKRLSGLDLSFDPLDNKEDEEAFSQPIPAQIDRYMKKFIDAVARGNLNRKRKLAILGRTIVALQLDPQEVSKYARLVKREL